MKEEKDVWKPHITYPTANGNMRLRQLIFTVIRDGDPLPDDTSRTFQGKLLMLMSKYLSITQKTS